MLGNNCDPDGKGYIPMEKYHHKNIRNAETYQKAAEMAVAGFDSRLKQGLRPGM